MSKNIDEKLNYIIKVYNTSVGGIEAEALSSRDRAYGGIIRASKGKLVERIGKQLVKIAWEDLNKKGKLRFVSKKITIPLKKDYLERIKNQEVKLYLQNNLDKIFYQIKPDVQVYINDEFKISMECKAYTENAMLKRILVDSTLINQVYPEVSFVLLQLESQLGGDYSEYITGKFGSPSTHTLLSYFDVDLNIITLLKGEREVSKPIHKLEFFKPLEMERLKEAVNFFKVLLAQ